MYTLNSILCLDKSRNSKNETGKFLLLLINVKLHEFLLQMDASFYVQKYTHTSIRLNDGSSSKYWAIYIYLKT